MEQNIHNVLKQAMFQPESNLSGDIFNMIQLKKKKIIKLKKFGYSSISILSLSGSIFSIKGLIEQSMQLGFYDYLQLAFSDSGIVATYWKEYTLSLVDSLPVASFGVTLFLLFTLFLSIRKVSYQFNNGLLAS